MKQKLTSIDKLFNVIYGHKLDMNKMQPSQKKDGIAFVGRRGNNQGVSGYVEAISGVEPFPAGVLTVALGGSYLLSSYVQQRPFYTAQNVAVLTPLDEKMTLTHRIYYASCIRHNRFRYSAFGREANRTLSTIRIPTSVPNWVDLTSIPTHDGLAKAAATTHPLPNPLEWHEFTIGSLFDIKKGTRLTKAERFPGNIRFIGASEKNNGVTDYNNLEPNFSGGQLTVSYNGSVGWAFYQDQPFFACDDVNVLVPKMNVSKWALLFVATVLKHEKSRYTYGFKWTMERMHNTPIRLPRNEVGHPDWGFMEDFMRGLPFSAAIENVQGQVR